MAKRITELTTAVPPTDKINTFIAIDSASGITEKLSMSNFTGQNVVFVNEEGDFGTPSAGSITLTERTAYLITTFVTMTNKLIIPNGVAIIGYSNEISRLTYNGAGEFMTTNDSVITFRRLSFDCPNATLLSADGIGLSGGAMVSMENIDVVSSLRCLEIKDTSLSINRGRFVGSLSSLRMSGTSSVFLVADLSLFNATGTNTTAIDLGSVVYQNLIVTSCTLLALGSGSFAITGLASGGNIQSGALGTMTIVSFFGASGPLSGIGPFDSRWAFTNCQNVPDTVRVAETGLQVSETVTINTQGVYERVNGGNWTDNTSDHFSIDTEGQVTYTDEISRLFKIDSNATIEKVGGGADLITMAIAIDRGSGYVVETKTVAGTQNSAPTVVPSMGIFELNEGDVVATFVANQGSTSDVTVLSSIIDITQL